MGTKKDPIFGAVIMVGMGGVAAEVFRDRALGLPPLNEAWPGGCSNRSSRGRCLQGYRGKPGVNIDRLIEIIMRFSYLVADYPEIKELDINPLLVTPEDVDRAGRPRGDRPRPGGPQRSAPYAHLAIRPYPEEYVTERTDEGRHAGRSCGRSSRKTSRCGTSCWGAARRSRSGSASATCSSRPRTRWPPATASSTTTARWASWPRSRRKAQRKLIGVGRLVADADHEAAEYAVIVVDRWHGHGLGGLLTDYCLEIARARAAAGRRRDDRRQSGHDRDPRAPRLHDRAPWSGRGGGDAGPRRALALDHSRVRHQVSGRAAPRSRAGRIGDRPARSSWRVTRGPVQAPGSACRRTGPSAGSR